MRTSIRSLIPSTTVCALALSAVLLLMPAPARAAFMVSNLGNSLDANLPVTYRQSDMFDPDRRVFEAGQFTTGATAVTFNSVTLATSTGSPVGDGFEVSLYDTVAGLPGTSLVTLAGSTSPSPSGNYTYTDSGFSLAANTSYFVVAGVPTSVVERVYAWNGTSDFSETAQPGWSIGNFFAQKQVDGGVDTGWQTGSSYALKFAVDASAVPEPSTWALLGLGLPALLAFRRRK